jgi:hypothetical protein
MLTVGDSIIGINTDHGSMCKLTSRYGRKLLTMDFAKDESFAVASGDVAGDAAEVASVQGEASARSDFELQGCDPATSAVIGSMHELEIAPARRKAGARRQDQGFERERSKHSSGRSPIEIWKRPSFQACNQEEHRQSDVASGNAT